MTVRFQSLMSPLVIGTANSHCPSFDQTAHPFSPVDPLSAGAEPPLLTGVFASRKGGGGGGGGSESSGVRGSWAFRPQRVLLEPGELDNDGGGAADQSVDSYVERLETLFQQGKVKEASEIALEEALPAVVRASLQSSDWKEYRSSRVWDSAYRLARCLLALHLQSDAKGLLFVLGEEAIWSLGRCWREFHFVDLETLDVRVPNVLKSLSEANNDDEHKYVKQELMSSLLDLIRRLLPSDVVTPHQRSRQVVMDLCEPADWGREEPLLVRAQERFLEAGCEKEFQALAKVYVKSRIAIKRRP